MGEFNYRKFLTENKLTYASREVAFSNLNEDLNKSDFEVGLTILNEIGYNINEDLLTEIKLKDFMTKVGSSIKNSVKALASDKSPSKNNKKDFTKKLALLKKLSPSEEVYNEFIELLKSGKKATVSDLTKLATSSSKEPIEELAKMSDGIKKIMAWVGLSIYLLAFANNLNYTPEQINVANQTTTTIDVGDNYTPILGDVGDTVAKGLDGEREDLSKEDGKKIQKDLEKIATDANVGQTVTSDGIDINFDTGQYETDIDKAAEQGAAEIIKNNPNLKSATLKYSSNISNTPGAQDDNPDGPDKTGLGEKRLDTAKKIALKIQKILQDKYPDAQIDLEDGGTNVSDVESQGEVDSGSDEAKSQQTSSVKLTDVQDEDKTPDPTPEDPTPDSDVKPMTPEEVIAFYSKKPDLDSNKYMVVGFHIVPRIIGNGKVINNPDFERVFKHIVVNEKGETFNEEFIKRRINPGGSLRKKLEKAKGSEKEEIEDAIKTLQFIKTTAKKGPHRIESWIKRLDPDIKLGERGAFPYQFEPGVENQGTGVTPDGGGGTAPGSRTKGTSVNLGGRKSGDLMQEHISEFRSIYNESISLLLEFNSNSLPGYNEDSAKSNLGLLTQLYVGTWGERKDGSIVEFDNEHLEDKYKSSVDSFYKTYPTVANKVRQFTKKKKSGEKDKAKEVEPETGNAKSGENAKAVKVKPETGNAKSGENAKAVKKDTKAVGKRFFSTVDDPGVEPETGNAKSGKKQGTKKDDKEQSNSTPPHNAEDKSITPQSAKALEKIGAKKDLTTALSRISNIGEAEDLMMALINYVRIDDDDKVKALKQAKARLTPLADQPKYTSTSTSGAKVNYNLKEHITRLIGLILEAEKSQKPDVEKTLGILDKYADLKSHLDRLTSKEMTIEFILGIMQFLDPILQDKANTLKTALSNVARDLEKEPEKSSNKVKPEDVKGIANQLKAETLIRKKIRSLIKEQIRRITESDLEVIDVGNEKLKFELKEDSGHYYVIARGEEDNNVKGIIPGIKNGNDYMDKKIKENLCKDSETFKKWAKSQFSDVVEEDFTIREDYNTIIKTIDGMKEVKKDNFCKIDFTKK